MNKKAAEIIAGVIPHKMTRNRWRGKLRYGIFKGMKLRHLIKANHSKPKYYLAVCALAKNEGAYFKEWIEWYRKMGVEKFYIYDNESTDNTYDILEPYIESGLVDYEYIDGFSKQLYIYDKCFEEHRFDARWIAVVDLDEFIVPLKDKSIPDFLKKMEEFSTVEINWMCYGSGGAKKKEPGGVMERFKYHAKPEHKLNRYIKSIVNPRRVYCMIGCHEAARINGKAGDSHGNPIKVSYRDREPQHDVIKINHYAVKSFEEFKQKQARGRARGKISKRIRGDEYFTQYDLNDIKD
ncbi:MAG: glycosyltransferase family 92 protein [Muribaculaceae bacterium]|nr:glycosyltransferase family 92 protein [Muribaculaceae bacterium]